MTRRIALILLLALGCGTLCAQTKAIKDLKNKQKQTMEQLAVTSRMIDENKKNTSAGLNRLKLLNNQIDMRKTLIGQISEEISLTNDAIAALQAEIDSTQNALTKLKGEYAELIYHAYWRRSANEKLMFILSANSLSQSYRRFRYLQELSAYRKEQGRKLEQLTAELGQKLAELENARTNKEKALNLRKIENQHLSNEVSKQNSLIQNLKKQEKDLLRKLQASQKQMNSLNDKIAKLIAEEERKAQERARAKALAEAQKNKANAQQAAAQTTKYTLTKEEQLLAGNFEKNKGRLPWPVEKGFISGKFGLQPHPVLTHVTTNNKGIYIQTEKNASARAVFEGEVTQRFAIPGNNYAVIVKHGNYRTVYSNLTNIYVKEGDHVTAKQAIGKIYTDPDDSKTELYFMIWKDKELQNPEYFLAK